MAIILWTPTTTVSSDDAGITVLKSVLPPAKTEPGPYESVSEDSFRYVPSLAWFCLKRLVDCVDQIGPALGTVRLNHTQPKDPKKYSLIRALLPEPFLLSHLDPRLWALLAQLYPTSLPPEFSTYPIPLSDVHLPLLQRIQPSSCFALVTVLELSECQNLTDETIYTLKALNNLSAFDASNTRLSTYGIKVLARGLIRDTKEQLKGPWFLRILSLRDCTSIDDDLFPCLERSFNSLCVLDLRGTRCSSQGVNKSSFRPCSNDLLYYPTPIRAALFSLVSEQPIFPSPNVFTLHITAQHHAMQTPSLLMKRPCPVNLGDTCVVLPPLRSEESKFTPGVGPSSRTLNKHSLAVSKSDSDKSVREPNTRSSSADIPRINMPAHRTEKHQEESSRTPLLFVPVGSINAVRRLKPYRRQVVPRNEPPLLDFSIDLLNATARTENLAHARRSAVSSFYRPLPESTSVAAADRHYPDGEKMMLLRQSPPKKIVRDDDLSSMPKCPQKEVVAVANSARAQEAVKGLVNMMNKQKGTSGEASAPRNDASKPVTRNPFRKKEKDVCEPTPSIPTSSKKLIPISKLPIPVLTPELRRICKEHERAEEEEALCRASVIQPYCLPKRKGKKKSCWRVISH